MLNPNNKGEILTDETRIIAKAAIYPKVNQGRIEQHLTPLVVNLLKIHMKQEKECCDTILDCLAHPELINYDNIPALAAVWKHIFLNIRIVVYTVDTTIENIIRGLELNDYRMNRVRMAQVKFVAEMYNHRVINFKLINDLLYRILCFGHPNNQPFT